jgi:DNA-binding CsgD family transcriptional regulator
VNSYRPRFSGRAHYGALERRIQRISLSTQRPLHAALRASCDPICTRFAVVRCWCSNCRRCCCRRSSTPLRSRCAPSGAIARGISSFSYQLHETRRAISVLCTVVGQINGMGLAVTLLGPLRMASARMNRSIDVLMGDERSKVLSNREREIALLVTRGLSNKELARELGISPGTIKSHVHSILQKLGASNRYSLMVRSTQEAPLSEFRLKTRRDQRSSG